jgi:hypothetical protein
LAGFGVPGRRQKAKPPYLRAGAWEVRSEILPRPAKDTSEAYGVVGAAAVVAVVSVFFVFFVFVALVALVAFVDAFDAFVFFVFSVFVVVVAAASCANTGIASENATANVNNSVKSFFM